MSVLMYLLKVILCSGILFGYYYLFLRNKRFHHYNRFYLLAVLGLSMVLPLIRIHVSEEDGMLQQVAYRSVKVVTLQAQPVTADAAAVATPSNPFTLTHLLWVVYGMGVLFLLAGLARSLRYIQKLSVKYPYEMIEQLKLFQTNEPGTPFSFFRSIYWNEELNFNSVKGQQIFRHELFHVQQRHSADTIAAELITMIGWFNPFFYLIKRELKAIHEFLADQYAASGSNRYQYAELLVQQVMDSRSPSITHPFFQNQLKRRIAMIMQHNQSKYGYWSRVMVLPISVFLFFSVSLYAQEREAEQQAAATSNTVATMDRGTISASLEIMNKLTPEQLQSMRSQEDTAEIMALVRERERQQNPRETAIVKEVQQMPVYQLLRQAAGDELDQQLFSQWWVIEVLKRNIAQQLYANRPDIHQLMIHDLNSGIANLKALIIQKSNLLQDAGYKSKLARDTEEVLLAEYLKSAGGDQTPITQQAAGTKPQRWALSVNTDTVVPQRKVDNVRFHTIDVMYDKVDTTRSVNFFTIKDKNYVHADTVNFRFSAVNHRKMNYTDSSKVLHLSYDQNYRSKDDVHRFTIKNDTVYQFEAVQQESVVTKLQRFFNKNYRYPVDFLNNHGEGSVYYSFTLDEQGNLKDLEVYNSAPKASPIYEIVIVGYSSKDAAKTLSPEEKHQFMKGEVDRVAAKNTSVSGNPKSTRYYFKATWKVQKEVTASKPITSKTSDLEKTYVKVDIIPAYTGGANAWKKYLANNLQYPAQAKTKKVEGMVLVQFVVKKEGGIDDLQASGPDELKAEAYRLVLNSAANWKPAVQNGQAVRAYMKQPIIFKL